MARCLFTNEELGADTKEAHTIQRDSAVECGQSKCPPRCSTSGVGSGLIPTFPACTPK